MKNIFHALVLNLHQPPGNLESLLETNEWEAKEILWALDRMPRSIWEHEDVARVHLSLSGSLLETLKNSDFQGRVYGIVKLGDLLWQLQNQNIFNISGTGYYHPVFPLIPKNDWEKHIERWLTLARQLFWRKDFSGFWPPEMGFCMEMIPLLVRMGFRYVFVDSENVEPVTMMTWPELMYRPHLASFGGSEITVIVRDRELSNAQESGMSAEWFEHEVGERTKWCDFPPLVTTCTDGENGGWFRNTDPQANFWESFYHEFLERSRSGASPIKPTFIDDYLKQHGASGDVTVRRAAWNTGEHSGEGFTQWTGGSRQRSALKRIEKASKSIMELRSRISLENSEANFCLETATSSLLKAETSCNFFWGDAWLYRVHQELDIVFEQVAWINSEW